MASDPPSAMTTCATSLRTGHGSAGRGWRTSRCATGDGRSSSDSAVMAHGDSGHSSSLCRDGATYRPAIPGSGRSVRSSLQAAMGLQRLHDDAGTVRSWIQVRRPCRDPATRRVSRLAATAIHRWCSVRGSPARRRVAGRVRRQWRRHGRRIHASEARAAIAASPSSTARVPPADPWSRQLSVPAFLVSAPPAPRGGRPRPASRSGCPPRGSRRHTGVTRRRRRFAASAGRLVRPADGHGMAPRGPTHGARCRTRPHHRATRPGTLIRADPIAAP